MAGTANITVRNLDKSDESLIPRIAKLHIKAFPNFFLTQLGPRFLMTLYKGYLEDPDSGILVAEDSDHHLLGFLAYSFDYSRFYKGLMKSHLATFALCSAGAAIKHPSFIKRLLGAFKKSDGVCQGSGGPGVETKRKPYTFGNGAYISIRKIWLHHSCDKG